MKNINSRIFRRVALFTLSIVILTCNLAVAQSVQLAGAVVSATDGEPIIGATISFNNGSSGTITDMNGEFALNNVPSGDKITISYLGHESQTHSVVANKFYDIALVADVQSIDAVVVVGFGSQKKINLTGSVGTVDSETFEARPVSNAVQALQGTVPGLNITQTDGGMGATSDINIRGVATINSGSSGSPLILIDGMEGDINTLNPQDIESISVLKDAAASSIYGSRAPFGVILITTKSGSKDGGFKVNYNNSFRVSKLMNLPEMVNSIDFANYYNDACDNNGIAHLFSDEQIEKMVLYQAGELASTSPDPANPNYWGDTYDLVYGNTDWFDELYKDNTFSQEHTLSLSGGNEKHQIYASINYLDQEGYMVYGGDGYERIATNLKATGEVFKGLHYRYNVKFQRTDTYWPTGLTDSSTANYNFYNCLARITWPMYSMYDANGYITGQQVAMAPRLETGGDSSTRVDYNYQQFGLTATPLKGWNINGEINFRTTTTLNHIDRQQVEMHDVNGDVCYYSTGEFNTSYVYEQTKNNTYLNPNVYTDYEFELGDGHSFKALVGFQSEISRISNFSAQREGILVSGMDVINTTDGNNPYSGDAVSPEVSGAYNDWAVMGYFARLNYNYKDRYLLEANIRRDGSSRFRSDSRWGTFPSVSAGWNIAQEDFWSDYSSTVGALKLRASYGELGNQNTSSYYPTYTTMGLSNASVNYLINGALTNKATHPSLISSDLTWETIKNFNVGVDFALFDNRLTGSFDYFIRNTVNMVGPATTMPAILGANEPNANNTDLSTYGWELSLQWNDRTQWGLGYSVGLQLADSQTEITSYPNPSKSFAFNGSDTFGGELIDTYYTGQMYGEIWGYETYGIARSEEEMQAHLSATDQTYMGSNWAAGDVMFKDINGDGKIDQGEFTADNSGDMKVIGNSTPRYQFGLNLSADYKGFDLRVFFQGVLKRDFYTCESSFWGASATSYSTAYGAFPEYYDYFRAEDTTSPFGANVDGYYPRPNIGDNKNNAAQVGYLQNAAYVRLKNAQLGYTFTGATLDKVRISNLRLFVSGENLLTFTKLSTIFDPETAFGGYNGMAYPLESVISMGINATF